MRHTLLMAVAAAAITAGIGPVSANPLVGGRLVASAAEAIPVQYWGGWGPPRVYDDDDDEPPVYRRRYVEPEIEGPIPAAQAIAIARSMGHRAISRPRLAGRVWVVEAVGSAGQRTRVTIHAYSGAPINIRELEPGGQRFPTPPVWRDERPSFGREGAPQPGLREGRLDPDALDRPERPAPRPQPNITARIVPVPTPRPNIDGDLAPRPQVVPPVIPPVASPPAIDAPVAPPPAAALPPRRVDPPSAVPVPATPPLSVEPTTPIPPPVGVVPQAEPPAAAIPPASETPREEPAPVQVEPPPTAATPAAPVEEHPAPAAALPPAAPDPAPEPAPPVVVVEPPAATNPVAEPPAAATPAPPAETAQKPADGEGVLIDGRFLGPNGEPLPQAGGPPTTPGVRQVAPPASN
ncbi:hypothetical protein ACJ4V0_16395 [Phreatobacter sp. HK31-P]